MPWPTVVDVQARLGVPAVDAADTTDLEQALAAAVDYTTTHSTVLHTWAGDPAVDPLPDRVWRGVVDLAVALHQRRGADQDAFGQISPAMWLSFDKLLGTRRYAWPTITGGS